MTWDEVIDAVVGSDLGDRHRLASAHLLDPDPPDKEGSPYHALAVYRPDPTISLLWGRTEVARGGWYRRLLESPRSDRARQSPTAA